MDMKYMLATEHTIHATDKSQTAKVRTHPGFKHIKPRLRVFPVDEFECSVAPSMVMP
jgi:hypothetical protein